MLWRFHAASQRLQHSIVIKFSFKVVSYTHRHTYIYIYIYIHLYRFMYIFFIAGTRQACLIAPKHSLSLRPAPSRCLLCHTAHTQYVIPTFYSHCPIQSGKKCLESLCFVSCSCWIRCWCVVVVLTDCLSCFASLPLGPPCRQYMSLCTHRVCILLKHFHLY